MKKFVWDIEKIREIQKSLDNSEIKKIPTYMKN